MRMGSRIGFLSQAMTTYRIQECLPNRFSGRGRSNRKRLWFPSAPDWPATFLYTAFPIDHARVHKTLRGTVLKPLRHKEK